MAAFITFLMLTLGEKVYQSFTFWAWHHHLLPLSEVLCVWGTTKVENEGDDSGEGYEEVPEAGGHCQVFGSPSEEPHHLCLFTHSDSLSAKTKSQARHYERDKFVVSGKPFSGVECVL